MLRKITIGMCLLLGLTAAQHAGAFTLWGPLEAWQTGDLDYGDRYFYTVVELLSGLGSTENGGPKNFGEGSRLTTPIVTYGFDATFLDYFGSQGVAAVDSAMQVLNALPSASTANLANFLTDGNQQINYTAQALEMLDLKSTVMWLMAEHMGLLGETHVYDLLQRSHYDNAVCDYEYTVINRNYDPITYNPSTYVNGRGYYYQIWDGCSIGVAVGDAIEFPLDATASGFTAVATPEGLELGGYYLGMTRDDVGGLQHLYKKNNYAFLTLDSNTVASPFFSSWQAVNTTNPIVGISNFSGLMGGVEKVTFVKVAYDSLLGTNFPPINYNFTVPYVTNYTLSQLKVTRTITAPDIIFTAADLVNSEAPFNYASLTRSGSFIASSYVSLGGGVVPSTIAASELVVLDNVGPVYFNLSPGFLSPYPYLEYPVFNWGTFDGSTNPPILYPNGSSLAELEQQVTSGQGQNVPVYPWAPVLNPSTNDDTGAGAGGGGGGAGAAAEELPPPVDSKIP
jgi:hypothetical protein